MFVCPHLNASLPQAAVLHLPAHLGEWKGTPLEVHDRVTTRFYKGTKYGMSEYRCSKKGPAVNAFVVLQEPRVTRPGTLPSYCTFEQHGWRRVKARHAVLSAGKEAFSVLEGLWASADEGAMGWEIRWYAVGDDCTPNPYAFKLMTIGDILRGRERTQGFFRVQAKFEVPGGGAAAAESARRRTVGVSKLLYAWNTGRSDTSPFQTAHSHSEICPAASTSPGSCLSVAPSRRGPVVLPCASDD